MGATRKFLLNSVLLSAVSIAVRFVSVSFNAHVAVKVGEECMGLFTLVASVFSLTVILASAGVNLAVVRKVSETVAKCEKTGEEAGELLRKIVCSASAYSLFFGVLTGTAVFFSSGFIARVLLEDERCIMSLKAFALSLPAISLSSALAGYFTGVGKVYKNAVCTVIEEAMKILVISSGLVLIAPKGIEYACLAIVGGGAAAQAVSLVAAYVIYVTDKSKKTKKQNGSVHAGDNRIRSIAALALPVAAGNVARHGLVTAEHLAIPRSLKKFGMDQSSALSVYGIFSGMVMPVVMFPSAVLYSFAGLLIPELASCRAVGNFERIKNIEEKVFRSSLLFSICVSGVLLSFSDGIGIGMYNNPEAARQLRLISVLIPVMYLDSAVDGMLKGLGEEVYCMKVNVADSALCLALVFVLVPAFGIDGFIALTIISEVINFALSVMRLMKVAPIRPDLLKWIVFPVASVAGATFAAKFLLNLFPTIGLVPRIAFTVVLYGAGCFVSGAVAEKDARWFLSLFRRKKRRAELSA